MLAIVREVRAGLNELRLGGKLQKMGVQRDDWSSIKCSIPGVDWSVVTKVLLSEKNGVNGILRSIRDAQPRDSLFSLVRLLAGCSAEAAKAIVCHRLPQIIAKLGGGQLSLDKFNALVQGALPAGNNRHLALGAFECIAPGARQANPKQLGELLGAVVKFVNSETATKRKPDEIVLEQFPQFLECVAKPLTAQAVEAAAGILSAFPNAPEVRWLNRDRDWDDKMFWLPETIQALAGLTRNVVKSDQLIALRELFGRVPSGGPGINAYDKELAKDMLAIFNMQGVDFQPPSAEQIRDIGSKLLNKVAV